MNDLQGASGTTRVTGATGEGFQRHLGSAADPGGLATMGPFFERSWALVIGIDEYGEQRHRLYNARRDAQEIARLFRETFLFEEVHELYDSNATKEAITSWLRDELPQRTQEVHRLIIFFAGHGATQTGSRGALRGFVVPYGAQFGRFGDYLAMEEFRESFYFIPARHIFLILDCCFSGVAALRTRASLPKLPEVLSDAYLRKIVQRSAWQILTAGASDERVADSGLRRGHSAFTGVLLDALEGGADENGDYLVTALELANWVIPRVARETATGGREGQIPFFDWLPGSEQGDFVFVLPRPEAETGPGPERQEAALRQPLAAIPQQENDLDAAWAAWLDHGTLASEQQLRALDDPQEVPSMSPAQRLFLLRSSVALNLPVARRLNQLRERREDLVTVLESEDLRPAPGGTGEREQMHQLLGLADGSLSEFRKGDAESTFGSVAWSAVCHPDSVVRQTAALALIVLPSAPEAGLQQIDHALHGKPPWKRFARRVELRGALADGDPSIERANIGLLPWDRLGIWFWRFWRRVSHDWWQILLLALGGGLGAGLGLGLLRALVVLPFLARKNPASYLLQYGNLGVLLGAVLCLGMLLAGPALLAPMRRWREKVQPPGFKVQVVAVLLGALFFGLALAAQVGLRGVSLAERPLVYLFGFVLGLGLSLALYGQPRAGRPLGFGTALLRVVLAFAVSAAIQAVFLWVPDTGAALDVALSINFYDAFFGDVIPENWMNWVALLDAALAGAVLAAGIAWGLNLADRLVRRMQALGL